MTCCCPAGGAVDASPKTSGVIERPPLLQCLPSCSSRNISWDGGLILKVRLAPRYPRAAQCSLPLYDRVYGGHRNDRSNEFKQHDDPQESSGWRALELQPP